MCSFDGPVHIFYSTRSGTGGHATPSRTGERRRTSEWTGSRWSALFPVFLFLPDDVKVKSHSWYGPAQSSSTGPSSTWQDRQETAWQFVELWRWRLCAVSAGTHALHRRTVLCSKYLFWKGMFTILFNSKKN
jgi:hypothetical protein